MKTGKHPPLSSRSVKKLKSVGSRRQMPLTVEGWREQQKEAPNEWLLFDSGAKRGSLIRGRWSA